MKENNTNNETTSNSKEQEKDDRIEQTGQLLLDENKQKEHLHLITIICSVEPFINTTMEKQTVFIK